MLMFTNNSKQNYLSAGIYPSTLTNVRSGVEDWVLQGKEQLHSNRKCTLGSGVEPFWGLRGQIFLAFNIIKVTKRFTMTLKQLYSWPKKLYQFMTNLFFLANIPTPLAKYNIKLRRILHPVTLAVGRLALGRDIYL